MDDSSVILEWSLRWDPRSGGSAWTRKELEAAREAEVADEIAAAPSSSSNTQAHPTSHHRGGDEEKKPQDNDDEGKEEEADDEEDAAAAMREHTISAINGLREEEAPHLRSVRVVRPKGCGQVHTRRGDTLIAAVSCCMDVEGKVGLIAMMMREGVSIGHTPPLFTSNPCRHFCFFLSRRAS